MYIKAGILRKIQLDNHRDGGTFSGCNNLCFNSCCVILYKKNDLTIGGKKK